MAMTEPSRLALSCEAISDWSCAAAGLRRDLQLLVFAALSHRCLS